MYIINVNREGIKTLKAKLDRDLYLDLEVTTESGERCELRSEACVNQMATFQEPLGRQNAVSLIAFIIEAMLYKEKLCSFEFNIPLSDINIV